MQKNNSNKMQIGDLTADFGKWQVEHNGCPVPLTNQSMEVLRALAAAWPDTVTQQALTEVIWPGKVVTDQSLKQAIKRLRESLGEPGGSYIKSVRGRGYRLECDQVTECSEPTARRPRTRQYLILVGLATAATLTLIGTTLHPTLLAPFRGTVEAAQAPSASAEAYQLYLSGMDYYQRYRTDDAHIAASQFSKAVALDPGFAKAWAALSDAQAMLGELDSAVVSAQTAITLAPGEAGGHKALGHAYSMKGWFRKAIESYAQTLELDPDNLGAISNTGFHWKELGQLDRAMDWNLRALRLDTDNAIVYLHVAETFKSLDMAEQAREWYTKARNLRPDYPPLFHSLAYFLAKNNDIAGAAEAIGAALQVAPDNSNILTAAGDIALQQGDHPRALDFYQRVLPATEPDKQAHYALLRTGQIRWLQGDKDPARDLLARARSIAEGLIAAGDEWPGNYVDVATTYAIEQDYALAHAWLVRAADAGWIDHHQLSRDPAFAQAIRRPEFIALQQSVQDKVAGMRERVRQRVM